MNPLAKNLLIRASAGSGKTYQLGNRVIGLVAQGVPPERIAALTFTRKAAGEFADSVLAKLARAATDANLTAALARELEVPDADFRELLARVVRALPGLMLGTMDSFFAKVVRSFQYELGVTGGRFELLEGGDLEAAREELLAGILGARLDADADDPFFHALRRAMAGREGLQVGEGLRDFVSEWQAVFREAGDLRWGPEELAGVEVGAWERDKHDLLERARPGVGAFAVTDKRQPAAMDEMLDQLASHTIGSGSIGTPGSLFASVLAAVGDSASGPLKLRFQKDFEFPDPAAGALRQVVHLLVRCELAAALDRTRAVREVVAAFDARCEERLRRRGALGFADVKFLMGRWARDETARLRREWVDFRLDSRHGHWLLDEFQDTSRADWLGLQPLIDEAASADDGSVFIVGDRKQAIYGWRGGEVGLFDEIEHRYRHGLEMADMAESWRSCPEVLELVNRVCGNKEIMARLFGHEPAGRWLWDDHVSAPHLGQPAKAGEARVEIVAGGPEARLERMVAILRDELGVGRRPLSCGILLRSNEQVRSVADFLRENGFDVIEEGSRQPAKDHPVGVVIAQLIRWLADPPNHFARRVVEMSPFGPLLLARHDGWQSAWAALTTQCARSGMAATVEGLVGACDTGWSEFGRRRAAELIAALQALETRGATPLALAADHLQRLEISQTPGVAAVQVMTIHKAKGLGFDIVMLPTIPIDGIPHAGNFKIAVGPDWLTQPPVKWARKLLPDLREAEARWAAAQRYEAMCLLYVALTRAKRGLYVLLDPPAATAEPDHPSLANWLARALDSPGTPGIVFQSGTADWTHKLPEALAAPRAAAAAPALGPAVPRRSRRRPTAHESADTPPPRPNGGAAFGTAVHRLFERISWLDEETPDLPDDEAGRLVAALLAVPDIRALLERRGRPARLLREQPVEAATRETWLAGIIDRLHLFHAPDGAVTAIELIDFKTDAVATPDQLRTRHRDQLAAYRAALALAYPAARLRALLLSTHLRQVIALDAAFSEQPV